MSTIGGKRIREAYNQAMRRCTTHYMDRGVRDPYGPNAEAWCAYHNWWQGRQAALKEIRDQFLDIYEQRERSKRNAKKRDHGKRRPRGS